MKPKLGCVPFLNAKPLIAWFSGEDASADVVFENPSVLGPMVDRGEVDAAIASSFFAVVDPSLKVAANVAIASNGPVRSVRLFSKVPFEEIRTLALDEASMTSNHLAQILLSQMYKVRPTTRHRRADLTDILGEFDAAVLIGDAGMAATADGLHILDLGSAWTQLTNKPFVWAFWVGRDRLTDQLANVLRTAREYGERNVQLISQNAARELNLPYSAIFDYLSNAIEFRLTPAHWEGFELFGNMCVERGFVAHFQMPQIVGEASAASATS
jgi:chorismate dehydratase